MSSSEDANNEKPEPQAEISGVKTKRELALKESRRTVYIVACILIILVILPWAGTYLVLADVLDLPKIGIPNHNQAIFGDAFTALGALFSGLAFAAVTIALLLQRADLSYQQKGLAIQLEQLARSVIADEDSSQALRDRLQQEQVFEANRMIFALLEQWHSDKLVQDRVSINRLISLWREEGVDKVTLGDLESLSLGDRSMKPVPGLRSSITSDDARSIMRLYHFVQRFTQSLEVTEIRDRMEHSALGTDIAEWPVKLSEIIVTQLKPISLNDDYKDT